MKIFPLIALFATAMAFSQPDSGSRGFAIPAAPNMNATPSGSVAPGPSVLGPPIFESPKSFGKIEDKPINSNFGKTTEWANPNEKYLDKLNKSEGEVAVAIRKNQYLGDVRTKSAVVKIDYRDHEFFDGDLIRVIVNDQVVKEQLMMESSFDGFELGLVPGFNKIEFEALNQGTSGPNTAEFRVYDQDGNQISSNRWNLATGFRATLILVRE